MSKFKSDIEIARKAKLKPIKKILTKLRVPDKPEAFSPMGRHIAKINFEYLKRLKNKKEGKLIVVHACGGDPANKIIKQVWPKENPFPSLYPAIIRYLKSNLTREILKEIKFHKSKKFKYMLRALPNEISGGIATSVIFSAWNAAVYVNQMTDEQIFKAEKSKNYQKIVQKIVNKHKGLYFNNELFVIQRK